MYLLLKLFIVWLGLINYHNFTLPFHVTDPKQAADQLLSYLTSAARKLCTYACPENGPLRHPVLTALSPIEKVAWQTIQMISDLDWSRKNRPAASDKIYMFQIKVYWLSIISIQFKYFFDLTFFKLKTECNSSLHWNSHLGQFLLTFQYRCIIDWRMDANGVTPMPVPISTACSARNMLLDGAPNGPSMNI